MIISIVIIIIRWIISIIRIIINNGDYFKIIMDYY
jgi:hypothetical protein